MERILENKKMIAIAAGCFVILLAIIITCAVLLGSDAQDTNDGSIGVFNDVSGSTTPKADDTPPEWKNLRFEETPDGCRILGVQGEPDADLIIPAETPSGKLVTEIGAGAFSGCAEIETISVPSTVRSIDISAFVGCSSLVAINVNSKNDSFCSVGGVLYSKNKSELICYPAAKVGRSLLLASSVKSIAENAFCGVQNLAAVYYEGSMSKFLAIEIAAGNDDFLTLPVTCDYVPSK